MGESLRERMLGRLQAVGITQTELAERLETSRRNVENWLTGKTQIPAHFVEGYLRVVPVDVRWLLTNEGAPDVVAPDEAVETLRRIAAEVDRARHSGTIPWQDMTPEAEPED